MKRGFKLQVQQRGLMLKTTCFSEKTEINYSVVAYIGPPASFDTINAIPPQ